VTALDGPAGGGKVREGVGGFEDAVTPSEKYGGQICARIKWTQNLPVQCAAVCTHCPRFHLGTARAAL
jgi:hypothetical protein